MTVRRIAALLGSTCVLALLAGCGTSVDTAKQNFKRTTVPATAATTGGSSNTSPVPTGSEDPGHPVDAIYSRDKLRTVYPCGLVDTKAVMGSSGTPEQPELQEYNKCFFTVEGSTAPRAYVTLDDHTYVGDDDPTEQVAGLTATIDDTISSGTCFVEGIIQRDPDRSITLQVHWDAGDACELGKKILESVVAKIKDGSSQYQIAQGNLVNLDPCAALTDAEATSALGDTAAVDDEPDLHGCAWNGQGSTSNRIRVDYALAPDPKEVASGSPKPVKINTVDGISEKDSSGEGCTIAWKHKPVTGDNTDVDPSWFETVEVSIDKAPSGKDACAAALDAAKVVQSKLPAP